MTAKEIQLHFCGHDITARKECDSLISDHASATVVFLGAKIARQVDRDRVLAGGHGLSKFQPGVYRRILGKRILRRLGLG